MANLVPLSNSSIIKGNKISTVKANKLLRSSSKIAKVSKKTNEGPKLFENPLVKIEKQVIQIDKILKDMLSLQRKQIERRRVGEEQKDFAKKEKELESRRPKVESKVKLPTSPKLGFFGWIKNFITNTILGFFAVRLIDFLPQLLKILPVVISAGDFLIDWGGKLLDGLITFVDWGYKAIDGTRQFIKDLGGESWAQNFDRFAGAVDNIIEIAVIAALATVDGGGFGGGAPNVRRGFDSTGRRVGVDAQKRYAQRYGKNQFLNRFGNKNLINLGEKGASKSILKFIRPLTKRLPIIGALLDFGLSVALGEDPGRAAFKAIGAGLLGAVGAAVGSVVPFAGTFLGGLAGGVAGDMAGGALYDMFFGKKKPNMKVIKAAGGGKPVTRGGKPVGGKAKRTISKRKKPRTLTATPTKLRPGNSIGGEDKIKKLYPESKDKTKMSPFDFLKKSYETFSESTGFNQLIALAIKPLMGDKPGFVDYKNAATGINNWMNGVLSPGTLAYAGGGEVKMESVIAGEDYSSVIAKSLQDSVAPESDKIIRDLMQQLMLKQPSVIKEKKDEPVPDEEIPSTGLISDGQWAPLLELIAGKESGGNYEAMYPSTTLPGATKMTIAEVARRATGAVGKYQQLPQYLVSRAKAAGLNPEKDLYSPENQDLIASKVNIEQNRGGRLWLEGKISDEQFMQRLSMEFAALPNARGEFYYPGQRSSIRPEQVKSALSKVKQGGYSRGTFPSAMVTGGRLPSSVALTSGFGMRWGRQHKGVDLSAGRGSPISSAQDATVIHAGDLGDNYGNTVILRYSNGAETRFAHLDSFSVKRGQKIKAGDLIGTEGNTGRSTGPHLHFEYYPRGGALSYSGYSNPTGVMNSYFRYGGNVKPKVLKKPMGETSKFHGGIGVVSKDGLTLKLHKGEMFKVVDKDSVDLFGRDFIQDIIDIENKSQLVARAPSIIEKLKAISGYTDYENPYSQPEIIFVPLSSQDILRIPSGMSKPSLTLEGGIDNSMSEQISDTLMYG